MGPGFSLNASFSFPVPCGFPAQQNETANNSQACICIHTQASPHHTISSPEPDFFYAGVVWASAEHRTQDFVHVKPGL